MASAGWPGKSVQVFAPDATLPPAVLDAVAADAEALSHCDNFWVPKERVLAGPAAAATPAELAVCLLHRLHVGRQLPPDWAGAEYWVQVYGCGAGLGFHFDKDEHLLKAGGAMVHPVLSSVLYLTGSAGPAAAGGGGGQAAGGDWDGARQAPTVILDQQFDQRLGPQPDMPARSALVWPLRGSYCLFDGRLGHGVLSSRSSGRRATMLVNWWTGQPQAVPELDQADVERLKLTRLAAGSAQAMCSGGSGGAGGAGGQPGAEQQPGHGGRRQHGGTLAAALELLSCGDGGGRRGQVPLPVCPVPPPPEGDPDHEANVQLVDDVLAAGGLCVAGCGAVSAVAFDHPAHTLYPIAVMDGSAAAAGGEGEAGSGNGGGSSAPQGLQTLGAFVSRAAAAQMGDEEDEQEDGEDAEDEVAVA